MRPLCLLLLTTACNGPTTDAEDTDVATLTFANGYPTDDPLYAGQQRFLYETFGTEILGDWPPVDFMLDLLESEPEVFGEQFSAFGFLPDPTDDLPIGLKRGVNDPTELHETCGLCHVDRLPDDTLWLGKPASRLDFGAFQVAVNERWVAAGHDPLFDEDVAARNLVAGPGRQRISSSDYDPAVIADLPPYFQLGARTALNYMGTGRDLRTEIHFSIFAFGAGAPNAAEARVPFPEDDVIDELTAFMGSLDAPPPATTQDPTLVARGEEVFTEAHCLDCHPHDVAEATNTPLDTGEEARDRWPGEDPAWPDGSITTSGLHRVLQDGDGDGGGPDEGLGDLLAFIASNGLSVRPTEGYRNNPLVGVGWTAPYLHNGSVPTLEDLLKPAAERPTSWDLHGFTLDVTVPANYNGGHAFGVDLPAEDKAALVAYLLTL